MARLTQLNIGGIEIQGVSLAGEETVICAPQYNVCFDVGRAPREMVSIDNVCLTHGHMDHAAGIAYYLSQRCFIGASPGRIILPRSLAVPIQRLMEVWADIEGHHSPMNLCPVDPLEDVEIRRNLIVRPFAVNHGGDALGFTLIEIRHKLKAQFHGKTGPQLVALKREGVTIEDRAEISLLTYTGDTAIGKFLEHRFVRESRVVVAECTFFESDHRTRAQAGRHIHVADFPKILAAVPDAQVLVMHLTRRTDLKFAKIAMRNVVGDQEMERITFLMDRPRRPGGRPGARNAAPYGARKVAPGGGISPPAERGM